jgi:hypothetical protein
MYLFKKKVLLSAVMLILGIGVISNQAIAQEKTQEKENGKLYGKVIDKSSEKALSEVEVIVATDQDTKISATTGTEGVYVFKSLEPGTYTATVQADGYKNWEKDVEVTADGKMLKIKLEPKAQKSS